jgi:hypothetical protein
VRIGKNLSNKIPVQNGLKQGDALSPLLFNVTLEFNGTHQLLAYADDVNVVEKS